MSERLENQKKKLSPACWLSSQMRLNLERAYERERIIKLIDKIESNETWCFDCDAGFDEDSDSCFRCGGVNIEHRNLDISIEKLKHLIDGEQR